MNVKLLKTIRNTLAALAVAAGIFLLIVIGAIEHDQITYKRFCAYAAGGIAGLALSTIGANLVGNELEWRGRK